MLLTPQELWLSGGNNQHVNAIDMYPGGEIFNWRFLRR